MGSFAHRTIGIVVKPQRLRVLHVALLNSTRRNAIGPARGGGSKGVSMCRKIAIGIAILMASATASLAQDDDYARSGAYIGVAGGVVLSGVDLL